MVSFPCSIQAHRQVIVKQVIPDSPVHVPATHAYPSPQIHIQPSAPGEIPIKVFTTCPQSFEGWIMLSTGLITIRVNKTNCAFHWIVLIYPVNSIIHLSNNPSLLYGLLASSSLHCNLWREVRILVKFVKTAKTAVASFVVCFKEAITLELRVNPGKKFAQ